MTLIEGFNLLATAPDGIKRLRELILSLAVQGKLVPQDPNDEPASELLKQIRAEKQRLVAEGKIKKDKPLPAIGDDEKPFALPEGWEWVRLPDISHNWGQEKPNTQFTYIDVASVDNLRGEITEEVQVLEAADAPSRARKIVRNGTVIYSTVRPYLKNIAVITQDYEPSAIASTAFAILHPHSGVQAQFLLTCLRSAYFTDFVSSKMIGVAYPAINDANFFQGVIPFPPLAEQSRIVAKVEELMVLCDALEARGQLEAEQHARLTATLLDALAASESAHQLQENWARLAASFDLVLDRPQAVDALEQTILQLAVRGLLVPQDPADESASELLKQIRAEKDRLIAEGKIKKDKPLPAISDDEKPFDLPQGWEWVRLGNAGVTQTGGTPASNRPEFFDGNFPFIGPGQITQNGQILPPEKFISNLGCFESATAEIGDILMVCIGGSIGKCASATFETAFNQQINSIHPLISSNAYILTAMSTLDFATSVRSAATGSATPIISKGKWDLLLLPMPPLSEQSRIVARVEALRALCGQLRERLAASRQTQAHLAEALVAQT